VIYVILPLALHPAIAAGMKPFSQFTPEHFDKSRHSVLTQDFATAQLIQQQHQVVAAAAAAAGKHEVDVAKFYSAELEVGPKFVKSSGPIQTQTTEFTNKRLSFFQSHD